MDAHHLTVLLWVHAWARRTTLGAVRVVKFEYRGTSLIRNTPPVGPYSSPMSRDLW